MNNLDKILKIILKKMGELEITKPTLSIVYDSIIEVYPKLYTKDREQFDCYRKIIIESITTYYDIQDFRERDAIKSILNKILKECLNS